MIATLHHSLLAIALITLLELAVIARILLRPHRDPASRIAWMVVVGVFPLLGMLAYLLLGEVNSAVAALRGCTQSSSACRRSRVTPLRTRRTSQPPFPSVTGTSFGSATRSAGSIPSVATP